MNCKMFTHTLSDASRTGRNLKVLAAMILTMNDDDDDDATYIKSFFCASNTQF